MSQKSATNHPRFPDHISLSLPAKVAGIVFWGMVLVGLLISVYLLNDREKMLESQYEVNTLILVHKLENILEVDIAKKNIDITSLESAINNLMILMRDAYYIEAIEFEYRGVAFNFGEAGTDAEIIRRSFDIHDLAGVNEAVEQVELTIYMVSLKQTLSDLRKKMLLSIGSLVFIFGLILQQILQRVLSRPILDMVMLAEQFADGDGTIRFDETRRDEFGYLATFINRALDAIMKHQRELEASQKALFEEKERAEVTLHSIMDGVITTSAAGRILYMNPIAECLSGWTNDQARDISLNKVIKLVHEDTGRRIETPLEKCLNENIVDELVPHAALIRHDGETVPIEASAAPMRNDEGEVIGAVMVFQDVSQARHLTRQLSYQASHDALTGLYNRRMFEERLEAVLLNVEEEDRHHALCYVDLDQFKIVNDTCGHMAGDELLRQLAILLGGCIRDGDTLARLGGDEFGLLLENCQLKQASRVADKIRQQVKAFCFVWQDKRFEIGASIGVVGISADNVDMASIMSAADVACYAAKDMGRNRVHIYEPTDAVLAERHGQMHWATRITKALEDSRLVLYQQPIVAMADATGYKHCEVLIRIKDEEGAIVRPDAFIPAAERYNLMPKVDRWVIQRVFQAMADNCSQSGKRTVAINLSGTSLVDDELLLYIRQQAAEYGTNLNDVCFEITETAAISNMAKATLFMQELKKQGCKFSLDDFGSGLSSFAYLKTLPVDYIKIDGSFVKDMSVDPIDRAMVEAITRVGHVMKIQTIAEWVEDEETLQLLREIGVDYVQGYHLGMPKEVEELSEIGRN